MKSTAELICIRGEVALVDCPFCEGAKEYGEDFGRRAIRNADGWWRVQCCNCDARGPCAEDGEEAAELWNRRTPTEKE